MSYVNGDPSINHFLFLRRGILFFWAIWLSVVFASNLTDGLKEMELLPINWKFASGNYGMIQKTIGYYSMSDFLAAILFGCVLLVQLATVVLFWRTVLDRQAVISPGHPKVLQPFTVAVTMFAGFLVADEVFIVYERFPGLETTHLLVFCALLLSLVVISVVGNDGKTG